MDKTKYFKMFLKAKKIIKKTEHEKLSEPDRLELVRLLDFFWVKPFTDDEWRYVKDKYGVMETNLDRALIDKEKKI